jgi:hypothetical protein
MSDETEEQGSTTVALSQMVIRSVNTLTERELPQEIHPTWNDRPPLLGRRNNNTNTKNNSNNNNAGGDETPKLLKGVSTTVYMQYVMCCEVHALDVPSTDIAIFLNQYLTFTAYNTLYLSSSSLVIVII